MICDLISEAKWYSKNAATLARAVAVMRKIGRAAKDGRYDIRGDAIYAIVSSYRTRDDDTLPFEAHRAYIDVQCILDGEERLDVAQGAGFRVKSRYSARKDVLFVYPPERYSSLVLQPGRFALLYPHDFHRPGQCVRAPRDVRKMVIKIGIGHAHRRRPG